MTARRRNIRSPNVTTCTITSNTPDEIFQSDSFARVESFQVVWVLLWIWIAWSSTSFGVEIQRHWPCHWLHFDAWYFVAQSSLITLGLISSFEWVLKMWSRTSLGHSFFLLLLFSARNSCCYLFPFELASRGFMIPKQCMTVSYQIFNNLAKNRQFLFTCSQSYQHWCHF